MLQTKKWQLRELKYPAQPESASKQHSWNSNPGSVAPTPMLETTTLNRRDRLTKERKEYTPEQRKSGKCM